MGVSFLRQRSTLQYLIVLVAAISADRARDYVGDGARRRPGISFALIMGVFAISSIGHGHRRHDFGVTIWQRTKAKKQ